MLGETEANATRVYMDAGLGRGGMMFKISQRQKNRSTTTTSKPKKKNRPQVLEIPSPRIDGCGCGEVGWMKDGCADGWDWMP